MKEYSQSFGDARVRRNVYTVPLTLLIIGVAVAAYCIGVIFFVLESFLALRAAKFAWDRQRCHAVRYEVDSDTLRIVRSWPYKTISVPFEDIRKIRYGDLLAPTYAVSTFAGRVPWTTISRATVITLLEEHKLDTTNPNSCNCIYWVPAAFGYYAYPPQNTDIRVMSFSVDAGKTVLIEASVNYLVSPGNPDEFVRELGRY